MSTQNTGLATEDTFEPTFVTANEDLRKDLRRAWLLAKAGRPLLIRGETGVGKTWLVNDLYTVSGRTGPLQTIECPALAKELMESEMFGHVKGAFTGAHRDRTGMIQMADGGMAFLDELGDLPLPLQAKLLRAVQENTLRKVGDTTDVTVDVRWVCATNVDLNARVRTGEFRQDLYFRLAQAVISIPPLRNRPEDIPVLIREHLRKQDLNAMDVIARDAFAALCEYKWPGNVRELFSVLDVALATREGGMIELHHLQFQPELLTGGVDENDPGIRIGDSVKTARRKLVEATLRRTGSRTNAALMLDVGYQTLCNWLKTWEKPK